MRIVCAIAVALLSAGRRRRRPTRRRRSRAGRLRLGRRSAGRGHQGAHDRAREHRLRPAHRLAPGAEHERPRDGLRRGHGLSRHPVPEPAELHRAHLRAGAARDRRRRREGGRLPAAPDLPEHRPEHLHPDRHGGGAATDPAAAPTWRTYAESMPANCGLANVGDYAARHNPAVYYPNDAAACAVGRCAVRHAGRGRASRPTWPRARCRATASSSPTSATTATTRAAASAASPKRTPPSPRGCPRSWPRPTTRAATCWSWSPPTRAPSAANGNLLATVLVNPDVAAGTQVATRFDALLAAAPRRAAARPAAARKRRRRRRHGAGVQPAAAGSAGAAAAV